MSTLDPDTTLKFEVENYKNQCFQICKDMADKNISHIKEAYEELYSKIDSGIKSNIMKSIGTKDLYNYDEIPEIKISTNKENDITGRNCTKEVVIDFILGNIIIRNGHSVNSCFCNVYKFTKKCKYCDLVVARNGFNNLVAGEKIVIMSKTLFPKTGNNYPDVYIMVFITNYGRYIKITQTKNGEHSYNILYSCNEYNSFDFWLPIDYINILNMVSTSVIEQSVLEYIKNKMYDRKLVPLYARDVVHENNELKLKYAEYERDIDNLKKEREEFENERKKFYETEKPTIDLIKDKKEIVEQREKLQLIAKHLKLEKLKIDKEKEALQEVNLEGFEI